jgi:lipoprotein NlpD
VGAAGRDTAWRADLKQNCWNYSLFVLAAALAATSCRTPSQVPDDLTDGPVKGDGVVHPVVKGQTLWRIARAYGVTVQELAEVNDLLDPTQIKVGQALWVPGAKQHLDVEPAPSLVGRMGPEASVASAPGEEGPALETPRSRFMWPVQGILFSRFGVRGGAQHDGIDISAPKGTPIVAADSGEVLYAGVQRGYGNIVLVKHEDGLITIYAHNERNDVKVGERVRKGQAIGLVGQTGRASGPHVHFEVRKARVPRNPLFFLP